ncbi:MAG: winged helix-turn-helix domain-containing protein [Anaerolineaceae bacterium]|nr:winged helix-turn-helix domain-containing protein [Anaerolineaceae bacterium]
MFLYQQIAEEIQKSILQGNYLPGDRVPTIREMMRRWDCAQGPVQRAYKLLVQQGLLISQSGRGTQVVNRVEIGRKNSPAWRQAKLVNQAESFLIESLSTGYSLEEIQDSIEIASRHLQEIQPVLS